jgi:hypothetical protein
MRKQKPVYDDDDGRIVADMSDLTRQNLLIPRFHPPQKPAQQAAPEPEHDRPWEDKSISPKERKWYILGALKAALLIALAFILGLGLIILLVLWLGK